VSARPPRQRSRKRAADGARKGRLTFAVEVVLCLALAYVAAGFAWTLIDPSTAGRDVSAKRGTAARATSTAFAYRVESGGLDPFRLGAFASADANTEDAPTSTLNLTVVGARVASAHNDGSAIIRTPDNAERLYHKGDQIVDGVVLERVEEGRVLVRRQGVIEALPFTQRGLSVLSSAPASRPSGGTIVSAPAREPEHDEDQLADAAVAGAIAAPAGAPSERAVSGSALMGSVAPRPAPEGEAGVALYPRGDGAAFTAAGFEPGDVVTMVNGVMVADASRLNEVLSGLGRGSAVNVRVERGRETASLDFVLE
jgi:general secretion pathway protein C